MGLAGKVGEGAGAFYRASRTKKSLGYEDPNAIKLSACLRKVTCYNQGAYAQYNFLAAEFHRRMRDGYIETPGDLEKLARLQDTLLDFLAGQMKHAYVMNIRFLLEYFQNQSEQRNTFQLPRVSIKTHEEQADPNQSRVSCLVRDNEVTYDSVCAIEENSALQYVKAHGRRYLCNDIPEAAKKDDYINLRLDSERAEAYSPKKFWLKPKFWNPPPDYIDKSWIHCWSQVGGDGNGNGGSVPADEPSCYKSTLVIPMTLLNNELLSEFVKMFGMGDVQRVIFGYLCIDHPEPGYFREAPDVDIGYIFADIMSLYLLTELTYTKVSSAYNKVSEALNNGHSQAE